MLKVIPILHSSLQFIQPKVRRTQSGSIWRRIATGGGCLERGDEPSASTN